jgi:hypothetical protein
MRRSDLEAAVAEGILNAEQAERLAGFLARRNEPRFSFEHVLYYLGGMIAIGAMTLFMTLGWNSLGGWGGLAIAMLYGALALLLTHWFVERHLPVPAGIMATLAVAMVPLAIFAAQMALGQWAPEKPYRDYHVYIDGRWVVMELGTLAAGAALFSLYRFPFMLMPIAVTLWYMSMDLVPLAFGIDHWHWEIRKAVSAWFGLGMILLAFWVDLRSRLSRDYAFWLYLFGVVAFWGGLSLMNSGSELGRLAYFAINVAMVLIGAILGRRVFAVFGGLGIAGYLGHVCWNLFKDSLIFSFALSAIGFAIIWLGVLWHRHEERWASQLRALVPEALRQLIEARALIRNSGSGS